MIVAGYLVQTEAVSVEDAFERIALQREIHVTKALVELLERMAP